MKNAQRKSRGKGSRQPIIFLCSDLYRSWTVAFEKVIHLHSPALITVSTQTSYFAKGKFIDKKSNTGVELSSAQVFYTGHCTWKCKFPSISEKFQKDNSLPIYFKAKPVRAWDYLSLSQNNYNEEELQLILQTLSASSNWHLYLNGL